LFEKLFRGQNKKDLKKTVTEKIIIK